METIRFYERGGLLAEPGRLPSGYRQYDDEVVARLPFIQRAKELGFTLGEIKELLSLRVGSEQPCDEVRSRAEAKIAEIEAKVALLLRMKEVLGRLASSCAEQGNSSRCPILEALDSDEATGKKEERR